MKRVWNDVTIEAMGEHLWRVLLDEKPIYTPAKRLLAVPGEDFADAIRSEWDAPGDMLDKERMLATRIAIIAIDLMPDHREREEREITSYIATELLCCRHENGALRELQDAQWQPWLDWLTEHYDIQLRHTESYTAVTADEDAIEKAQEIVTLLDDFHFAALALLVRGLGSFVLGLAVLERTLDVDTAYRLSVLDEDYQRSRWGSDAEAAATSDLHRDELRRIAEVVKTLENQ